MLKEPYSWIVDNSGARQSGLELTWTLDFEGRGRQGRVRAKVKKIEAMPITAERTLRSRPPPANPPADDEDDEEDDDYEDDNGGDASSSDSEEEEEVSEFVETPRR